MYLSHCVIATEFDNGIGHFRVPSRIGPLYQNKVKCSAFDIEMNFHPRSNNSHFHKKGCPLGLILKVRVFGTRKWPITTGSEYYMQLIVRTLNMNYDRKEVPVKPFCIMQTFPNDISWFTT